MNKRRFALGPLFVLLCAVALSTGLFLPGCELLDPNPGPDPITSGSNTTALEPVADTVPASVERGQNLFQELCARCHGNDGSGSPIWPPSIQGKIGIIDIVRHGRRAMPAFPTLSDSVVKSLELYLNSFNIDNSNKNGAELFEFYCQSCHGFQATGTNIYAGNIQGYSPIRPLVKNGRGDMLPVNIPDSLIDKIQEYLLSFQVDFSTLSGEEYYARLCASCHGAEGEGTERGTEIRNPVTEFAKYIIRNGRTGHPDYERDMPRYDSDSLSDKQLDEIITWLRSAVKPYDGASLYTRFCANCHGSDAQGDLVDKSIRNEDLDDFIKTVRDGEGGRNYGRRTSYMPSWSSIEISDDEIERIYLYVRTIR